MADTFIPYLALIASLNIANWVTQRISLSSREIIYTKKLALTLGLTVFGITWFLAPLLETFYNSAQLTWAIRALSITFVLRAISAIPEALLQRELKMRGVSLLQAGVAISRGVLQLFLAWLGYGVWALIAGVLLKEFAYALILLCYLCPKVSSIEETTSATVKNSSSPSIPPFLIWKEILAFGLPVTVSTLLWIMYTTADNVVIGRTMGSAKLGLYALSFYLADLPLSKLNSIVRPILIPFLSRLRVTSENFSNTYFQLIRFIAWISLPILAGICAASSELVSLLLGPNWLEAIHILRGLTIVCAVRAITDNIPPLFFAIGKPQPVLKFNLICAVCLPIAFFLLGSHFGMYGIYFSWIVIYGALSLALIRSVTKEIGRSMQEYLSNLKMPSLSAVLIGFAIYLVKYCLPGDLPVLVLLLQVVVGMASLIICLKTFAPKDLSTILKFSFPKREETQN